MEAIPSPHARALADDEGAVDEPRKHVDHVGDRCSTGRPDRLRGLEVERAGKRGEPAEERALVRLEEVVAPGDRRFERLLPGSRRPASADEQPEAVGQSLDELVEAERAEPDSGQLDRERHPVEPPRQLEDGRPVLVRDDERGARLACPFDQQGDGLRFRNPIRRDIRIGRRDRQRPHPDDRLAAESEGLPARGDQPQRRCLPEQRVGEHGARVEEVLAVVEDDEHLAGRDVVDQPGDRPAAGFVAKAERRHDRLRHELRITHAGKLDQPRTIGDAAGEVARDAEGEAGLADAPGPDEGHESGPGQGRLDVLDVPTPADERRELGGQISGGGSSPPRQDAGRAGVSDRSKRGIGMTSWYPGPLTGHPGSEPRRVRPE